MRKIAGMCAAVIIGSIIAISFASADTIDTFLTHIKDPSADVRVKAIEDLCAG